MAGAPIVEVEEEFEAPNRHRQVGFFLLVGTLAYLVVGAGVAWFIFREYRKPRAVDVVAEVPNAPNQVPIVDAEPTPVIVPEPVSANPTTREKDPAITAAIDRGVAFLKLQLKGMLQSATLGSVEGVGVLALAGLTLLECDVPADDPQVIAIAKILRATAPSLDHNYSISLTILFMDRLGASEDQTLIRRLALRLIANQTPSGDWNYNSSNLLSTSDEHDLFTALTAIRSKSGRLPSGLSEQVRQVSALRSYSKSKPAPEFSAGDNSNTQFVILALWVAHRHDLPVEPALALVDQYLRRTQQKDGSWFYSPNQPMSPASMTCAGLLGLAVGRGIDTKIAAVNATAPANSFTDPAIEKGMRFVRGILEQRQVRQTDQLPVVASIGKLYFLWSLARVAMIYDLQTFGDLDWYAWASAILLHTQQPDGSWMDAHSQMVDTCFALLVLERVNVAKDLTTDLRDKINAGDLGGSRRIKEPPR